MEVGIIGIPYIGKTTLFSALTAAAVADHGANQPNVGMVKVPDPRLGILSQYIETREIHPATIQVVDVAGLVAGASKGEGLGNKFLFHVRNVDALLHVVRCFEDPNVPHVDGSVNAVRDVEQVELELIFADMEQVQNMLEKAPRQARTGEKAATQRLAALEVCNAALEDGMPISSLNDPALETEEAQVMLKSASLLSSKPVLYVANVGEDDLEGTGEQVQKLREHAKQHGGLVVPVCAKLDAELKELDESERAEMLEALGLAEPALNVLARAAYELLGLQSYFTAGIKETRAWTIPIGATGPQAAGVIHSDFERGFIRVEVYSVDDLVEHKTEVAIRAAGKMRVEGKSYIMQDGDVCHFLFNV